MTARGPVRILFVFARLAVGGEETEVSLLAQALDPAHYRIDVVACFCNDGVPEQPHAQLAVAGVAVDTTPCHLSFDDTVTYLTGKMAAYDIVVACQNVADVYPALERMHLRPALIEHGRLVSEALAGPKHFTSRYIGVSAAIRDAAASRMPGREDHALEIPSMVDTIVPLIDEPSLRSRLGTALHAEVLADYARDVVVPRWIATFDEVVAERVRHKPTGLFASFMQGGFECSTHRRAHDRRRLDVIAASNHDVNAEHDYQMLHTHGIRTVRDGVRWHLIESTPGVYDWSSLDAQLAAARKTRTEVIWDLLHYGWPDDVDIWQPEFIARFAAFAEAAARHIGPAPPGQSRFFAPVNEISFLAWGGGDAAYLNPFAHHRGLELKVQLARAAIAAMAAISIVDPAARFVHPDPAINIVADPTGNEVEQTERARQAQYQGWDMIAGLGWPQLGGRRALLDIVGVNFYHNNQWLVDGTKLAHDDPRAKPLHALLAEVYARYGRPIFVSETGIEGAARPEWLRMIGNEVARAIDLGVPVEGICLYPVLDHPGWDNDRYCPNGLLRHSDCPTGRVAEPDYAEEVLRQIRRFDRSLAPDQLRAQSIDGDTFDRGDRPAKILSRPLGSQLVDEADDAQIIEHEPAVSLRGLRGGVGEDQTRAV